MIIEFVHFLESFEVSKYMKKAMDRPFIDSKLPNEIDPNVIRVMRRQRDFTSTTNPFSIYYKG